ncbi:hypothetical protein BC939DRAFT_134214 [Gamsiella multidivaricata]|uniref:uncharacterized protein n=1 Tax=Gamsiella multidivaricata TaxID=101098 RepID=UPI00221E61EA|nr:uncharacterized protein BC939DRAFT_134214 [Gamsiella multidivaricata]KAI7824757.1 hypothetical protein BC939DRAFT_134214 [Gamsiella multidivaricata]
MGSEPISHSFNCFDPPADGQTKEATMDSTGKTATASGAMDSTLYYKAVGSIAIYFATVISALVVCITRTRFSASNAIYILIAVSSLLTTWYYILSWFKKEYEAHGSNLDRFILESDLFVQAYAIVTNTLPKWWWSSQLLILTGTALTCWSVEGQSLRLETTTLNQQNKRSSPQQPTKSWTPTWWFVLLGFFGSMSVGGPLFLAQLDPTKKTRPHARTVPLFLALLILLGEKRFLTVSLPVLYFVLALIALVSHVMYTLPFVFSPIMQPSTLYRALWFNHCQTSISADLVFNNLLAAVYMFQSSRQLGKPHVAVILTLVMPILSVSTVLPLYLGWKERQSVVKETVKPKKA